jgi:hypothetical protein
VSRISLESRGNQPSGVFESSLRTCVGMVVGGGSGKSTLEGRRVSLNEEALCASSPSDELSLLKGGVGGASSCIESFRAGCSSVM